jgi:hypothetical protein
VTTIDQTPIPTRTPSSKRARLPWALWDPMGAP